MRKKLFILLGIGLSSLLGFAQPANIALNANSAQSGGGSGDSGPQNYNDGFINDDIGGITGNIYGTVNSGGWIEYTWDTPQTFQDIVFYYAKRYSEKLSQLEVQIYDSSASAYVTVFTVSSGLGQGDAVVDTVKLPSRVTASGLRFNNLQYVNGGNPALREIEVYEAFISPDDASITAVEPTPSSCPGSYPIYATLRNDGSEVLNSAIIYWSVDGVIQPYVSYSSDPLDTIGGTGNFEKSVYLGDYNYTAQSHEIKVWTSEPNGNTDTLNYNDTVSVIFNLTPPSGLKISNIASTSVDVSWDAVSSTNYEIIYGTMGFNPDTAGSSVSSITSSPYNLTGLSENTNYELYIVASCPGGNSDTTGPVSFRTICDPTDLLSGTYTVDKNTPTGGMNYNSFLELANDLNSCGVSGPVTVNVSPGRYEDRLHLYGVRGVSTTNTITINGSGSDTIVWSDASPQACVLLVATKHVTLNNLNLVNDADAYDSWGIFVGFDSDSVTIENCNIRMNSSTIKSDISAIVVSSDYTNEANNHEVDHLTIRNCDITGGYYAVAIPGNNEEKRSAGFRILNNTIRDFRYSAIWGSYHQDIVIKGNIVSQSSYAYGNAVYFTYLNDFIIEGNYIYDVPNVGLYLSYLNDEYLPSQNSRVVNNMVSSSGGIGIRLYGFQNLDVFHNSVKGEPAIYLNDPVRADIRNNIFTSTSDYALESLDEFDSESTVDYNIYFAQSGDPIRIYNADYTFNGWKTKDAHMNLHSKSGNPLFSSDTILRPLGLRANDAGDNSVGVTEDIEGDTRPLSGSATVDIGADEYNPPGCPGVESRSITNLDGTSVTIALDGTGSNYDVEVGTCGFTLGSGGFTASGTDPITVNGLSAVTCYEYYVRRDCGTDSSAWFGPFSFTTECLNSDKLSGTYTIDSSQVTGGRNYNSFGEAITDLSGCGVNGPVVFNVAEGTYEEQVVLGQIQGSDNINNIVFQSDPANTEPAEIAYGNTSFSSNYVWKFDGASYVTLRNLEMTITATSTYRRVIDFSGMCSHIIIEDNILNGDANPTSTSNYRAVIINNSGSGNVVNHTTIRNNIFNGGSYAIYWYGIGSDEDEREIGNIIDSNSINEFYYYGIYSYYQDDIKVRGNEILSSNLSGSSYGIRHYYNSNTESVGNKVVMHGTSNIYGLSLEYAHGQEGNPSLIANNMISALDNSGTTQGIYILNTSNINLLHNSVLVNAGSDNGGRSLYVSTYGTDSNVRILNNNFVNTGGGYASYIAFNDPAGISEMDHNNYYFTGTFLGSWGDLNAPTLTYWQTKTILDVNSLNANPIFRNDEDLHISSAELNAKGVAEPLVMYDFDGDIRSGSVDIGADEFAFVSGNCNAFSGFSLDSLSNSGVKIEWTAGSGSSSFSLEYGTKGFTPGSGTSISGTYPGSQPPVYINGLYGKTEYDILFREYCNSGADSSTFEKRISFETKVDCPPVSLPELVHALGDSIAISFVVDDDQSFQFEYGPKGYDQGTGTSVSVNSNPGGIGGLDPLTEYDIYIRNNCGATGSSPWTGPLTVLTGCESTLSGTYTVNSSMPTSGSNFNNFADLMQKFEVCGVSGPVTVNVASGIYEEQFRFSNFNGISESNPVVIQADPSNSSPAELRYTITTSFGDNWAWKFEGASNVIVRGLTLTTVDPGGSSGRSSAMIFDGRNENITIEDNILSTNALPSSLSTNKCVINTSTNTVFNSTFRNNTLQGGSYGMYFITSSSEFGANITLEGNTIEDFHHYGIYMRDMDSMSITGNIFTSNPASTGSSVYGLYLESSSNIKVTKNKMVLKGSVDAEDLYGIYMSFCTSISYNPNLIANNMISILDNTGEAVGIYNSNTQYTDVVYNSVLVNAGSASESYALNSGENPNDYGFRVLNNNFVNTGGGAAARIYFQNSGLFINELDYNNYYTTALLKIGRFDTEIPFLIGWTHIEGKDMHSISVDPLFYSNEDLHAQEAALYNAGIPFEGANSDYDGETRSGETPVIGADEFIPAICLPSTELTAYATGSDSIALNWTPGSGAVRHLEYGLEGFEVGAGSRITGIADSSHTITGLTPQTNYDIYLRDYCGPGDSSIWKGPVTVRTTCMSQLSGTYTIDNGTPATGRNFTSFADAAFALNDCGVSGPVIFNVASGNYFESLELLEVNGVSSTNTVTFQADPSNSQPVVLESTVNGEVDNFIVMINGMDYLTIRGLTMNVLGNGYGRAIVFKGMSEYVTIEDNILNGVTATGESSNEAVIVNNSTDKNILSHSMIRNNEINNGSYGIYWYGVERENLEQGNIIDSNTINGFLYTGIQCYHQSDISINGNYLESSNVNANVYGMRALGNNTLQCTGNTVIARGTGRSYGLYISELGGSSANRNMIANNMISVLDNIGRADGIYSFDNEFLDIAYNSVLVNAGQSGNSYGLHVSGYLRYGDSIRILNNNIVHTGLGYAVVISDGGKFSVMETDHNNFYSAGPVLGSFDGDLTTDLTSWKNISGMDAHSISADPLYVSETDLHTSQAALNGSAIPYDNISTDIEGDLRSSTMPDIGADEFNASYCKELALTADLNVIDILFHTAMATWSAEAGTRYNIEYGETGFERGTGALSTNMTDSFKVMNNLDPATTYDVYLRYVCSGVNDTSLWIGPFTFTTACTPINTFPWTEDFETSMNDIPVCWANENNDDSDWIFASGAIGNGATSDHTTGTPAGYYASIDDSHISGDDTVSNLLTPLFDLTSLAQPQLSFWYFIGDAAETSSLFIDIYDGNMWHIGVDTIEFTTEAWLKDSLLLGAYASAKTRIRFRAQETTSEQSDLSIDDVVIMEAPVSCNNAPDNLSVDNVSCEGADLLWNSASIISNSVVEYGGLGFVPGTGTKLTYVSSPQTIGNLAPGTDYEFYVYDTCSAGSTTDTTGPFAFASLSNPSARFTFTRGAATATEMNVAFDASASEGASSYSWDFGDGSPAGNGKTTHHDYTSNSSFVVTLTITGDCGTATFADTIDIEGVSVKENPLEQSLHIYPNPTTGQVYVSFDTESSAKVDIIILDLSGKTILKNTLTDINGKYNDKLDLSHLAAGTYIIEINSGNRKARKRILKQ